MNYENLAFLQDNLKYLGFGEHSLLNHQLEAEIAKEPLSFELYTEAFFDEDTRLEAKLHFRRSDTLEMYFFNKYDALLRYSDIPDRNKAQTFFIYKGSGVTLKEAFNLLQGRAVYKNLTNAVGEKYTAWIQLNFEEKNLHDNYRFRYFRADNRYDLSKVLSNYKLREMENEETKEVLFRSLRRGNVHPVTLVKANKTERILIHANPQYKMINIVPPATRAARKDRRQRELTGTADTGATDREVNESLLEEDAEAVTQKTIH